VARAHLFRPITDQQGNLLYNATVTVRETDFAVPVGQPLYASATGSDTLDNPFVTPSGVIDFWLDTPQRVSLLVQADGMEDIQVYLDAPPAPEEIVSSTAPVEIVNQPTTSGQVLLSTGTPGQFQWGNPPSGTGLTPVVVTSSQSFSSGSDPAGWTINNGSAATHTYDPSTLPPNTNYLYSLHGQLVGNSATLTVTGPSFTLLESGRLSLWVKASVSAGDSLAINVTAPGPTTTNLGTVNTTRDWGFYSYNLAAGTYTPSFVFTGPSTLATGSHDIWLTGYVTQYGGNVPVHQHNGSGTNSVALGTSATATATASTAVGVSATASGTNATAFGYNAQATGNSSLAVGMNASANADFALAVGSGASGSSSVTGWAAVGYAATASGLEAVAVGKNAAATADYASAVGSAATASGASSVAIGQNASAQSTSGVAIGQGAVVSASHTNSVALGASSATTGANQIMLGNAGAMTVLPGSFQNLGLVSLGTAGSRVGFYGSTGNIQQVISGSDDGNVTVRTLVQALANMGLIVNNSLQQPAPFANPVGIIDYFYRQDPGDGTLGSADFDFQPYTYAPLAYTASGPYPSAPQWYVGTDHNGYKGVATGLGALKNTFRSNHSVQYATFIQTGSTGNKICMVLRHSGQTDGSASAVYVILDQAAGTIACGVSPNGSPATVNVASGNSLTLSSLSLTPFDGNTHNHLLAISGKTVMYVDMSQTAPVPVFFYDTAIPATGTYSGMDFNSLTALNSVTFLPPQSFDHFRVTGALTNLDSGEAWQTATSGSGAAVTVNTTGNLQTTGATSGYGVAYFLTNSNTTAKTVKTKFTGTIQSTSGIIGRFQDASNYYLVNPTNVTKVSSGSQTNLGSAHSSTFVSGDVMRVVFNSNGVIQVFRNGTQVNSVTDTTFSSQNRFGVGIRGTGTANWPWVWVYDSYNSAVIYK
jgi:hypothetical protein